MTAKEEQLLVQRIQNGDSKAFEQLMDAYETRVYRLALRFTGNVPDAEDVTLEIFHGVYRSIGRFRGNSALGTWIYRIAMNHCLEYRRKKRLDVVPYDEEIQLQCTNWESDPVAVAQKQELSEQVEAAINSLSPMHREVVVLHELQGLTYQEVAATLNVPVGTVKSRLSNAFKRLREQLGSYAFEGSSTV
jgi:RNA polymerase sigma-70 factor, ECF subfamily